jgi:hypothetical protein
VGAGRPGYRDAAQGRWPVTAVCPESVHEALKLDDAAWSRLESRGTCSIDYNDGGPPAHFSVRNCTCRSTLYKRISLVDVAFEVQP